jgi:two-component system phosphate regulon sensor histidine kinase PhoR
MDWFFSRVATAVLLTLAGAGLGGLAGWLFDSAFEWLVPGALAGAATSAFADRARGYRLLKWVQGTLDRPAPKVSGFWGELAYRIERILQQRDRQIQSERDKLSQFLSAIEASPNGVMILDEGDHIQWCNKAAAQHFGLDPVRDLQQRITHLLRVPAFVAHLQAGSLEQPVTFPNPRAPGTLSVLVRPYGGGMKLMLSQDITERERAEAMRRDFVANVSHEIRTPLTVLAGFVETLADCPLEGEERERVLGHMGQQTARMQALVADLLTLAQLEGSPRPSTDHWLTVASLVEHVLEQGQLLSAGRHVIEADADTLAEIAGSASELQSALGNLVTNAVRYTPEGGRIRVRWADRADGGGQFEVSDTGSGIAREHLPRLTERFYRVDSGRSRDSGGTGLGLAIVKHVMQRHGGEIDIESEPGKGSTFRLVLPALRLRRPDVATAGRPHDGQVGP